jgi:hypothetical protein
VAAIALAIKSWFPFIGEPVADDFDFIHHTLFAGPGAWLDGGGSSFYWRPLARQLYYALLDGVTLAHPMWVAVLHTVWLALAGRALSNVAPLLATAMVRGRRDLPAAAGSDALVDRDRHQLPGSRSAAVQRAGLCLASRGWRVPALVALLAALLCKEWRW